MTDRDDAVARLETRLALTRSYSERALRELHAQLSVELDRERRRAARAEKRLQRVRERLRRARRQADRARRRAVTAEREVERLRATAPTSAARVLAGLRRKVRRLATRDA